MKFYVEVQRAGTSGQWRPVNAYYSESTAISSVVHRYGNPSSPMSRGVMAVRVVKGRRAPTVVYERVTS